MEQQMCLQIRAVVLKISCSGIFLHSERSRSSMDRMADSGSGGWAFESPRDHKGKTASTAVFCILASGILRFRATRTRRGGAFEPNELRE